MKQKIVVIGSNSFSGSHFVSHVLENGFDVIGISRSVEPDPVFLPYKKNPNPCFRFYQFDLNHNLHEIIDTIEDFEPDYIVNFASQGMVEQSWQYPEHWFQTNVVANVKLHDRLRKCDFLKKYVHVSTPEVYGSCEGVIKESTLYNPSTPYAVSRAGTDMSLMAFYRAYNFPVVFTRAANVYGPGQQLYRIIPRTILFFTLGKKLELHGGGDSVRSFIHIHDVVDGTLRVARMAAPSEIYHLSTERNISIHLLVQMIAKKMGVSFEDHVVITKDRLGKDSAYLLDSSKAKEKLGWVDTMTLEKGIEQTIAWINNNLDILKDMPLEYIHKP